MENNNPTPPTRPPNTMPPRPQTTTEPTEPTTDITEPTTSPNTPTTSTTTDAPDTTDVTDTPSDDTNDTTSAPTDTSETIGFDDTATPPTAQGGGIVLAGAGIIIAVIALIAVIVIVVGVIIVVSKIQKGKKPSAAVSVTPASGITRTEPVNPPAIGGGWKIANLQGQGARQYQQDSFALTDITDTAKGMMAIVADGMGGVSDGDVISRLCTQTAVKLFGEATTDYVPNELLAQITAESQREARAFIASKGYDYSGSTLVCVILKANELHFTAVGDSRIVLLRGDTVLQLNREHTHKIVLDEQAARGEITFEEARTHKDKDALISYIGVDGEVMRDYNTSPIPLQSGDRVVLMSDGVFGTVPDDVIAKLATIPDITQAGTALENAITTTQKPNQDNYTAVIIEN
ncbi:MAG: serine/threonine-protein phosphatase [Oscillospiraceae bacterium]|nr:serine/threonine-protein phosphatase [Oscillospiraceae bacterium]